MSRIGRLPIPIPDGVEVTLDGQHLSVTGPLGTLERDVHPEMEVVQAEGVLRIVRPSDEPRHRALHGLTRSLVANMVTGVSKGFEKRLTLVGVGFRAQAQGDRLNLSLGFSHPVVHQMPKGVKVATPTPSSPPRSS